MKIGVLSDTHDHLEVFDAMAAAFKKAGVTALIHCGDWVAPFAMRELVKVLRDALPDIPIKGVLGNNEGERFRLPALAKSLGVGLEEDILETVIDGRKIAIYHGTAEPLVEALVVSQKYDLVCRGHTHTANQNQVSKTLELNPGTPAAVVNFDTPPRGTVAVYDTKTGQAEIVKLNLSPIPPCH